MVEKRGEDGKKESVKEKIPLPEEFDLGLDKRGVYVNSSARRQHNMGANRMGVFPREGGGKGEGRNWLANFTRAGCVGCKDKDGKNQHNGRSGEPLILVIGDEATPCMVGYTKEGGRNACCWVFKKEHLALQEVAPLIKRLGQEKKDWDRECGGGATIHSCQMEARCWWVATAT